MIPRSRIVLLAFAFGIAGSLAAFIFSRSKPTPVPAEPYQFTPPTLRSDPEWATLPENRKEAVDTFIMSQETLIAAGTLTGPELRLVQRHIPGPLAPGFATYPVANGSYLLVPSIPDSPGPHRSEPSDFNP